MYHSFFDLLSHSCLPFRNINSSEGKKPFIIFFFFFDIVVFTPTPTPLLSHSVSWIRFFLVFLSRSLSNEVCQRIHHTFFDPLPLPATLRAVGPTTMWSKMVISMRFWTAAASPLSCSCQLSVVFGRCLFPFSMVTWLMRIFNVTEICQKNLSGPIGSLDQRKRRR